MKNQFERKIEVSLRTFSSVSIPHLQKALEVNSPVLEKIRASLVDRVKEGQSLFIFGSGHSALLPLEVYHRAGGASFIIPLIADFLLPHSGPPLVRMLERTSGIASVLLDRCHPREGEMIWLVSQSGINAAIVEMALEAKKRKLSTVALTNLTHSRSVMSRHPSGYKLFEVCDEVIDLGGSVGDAAIEVAPGVLAGPLSTLTGIFLAHSVLCAVVAELEAQGVRCVYTSVNTAEGEVRNRDLEKNASIRDPVLR